MLGADMNLPNSPPHRLRRADRSALIALMLCTTAVALPETTFATAPDDPSARTGHVLTPKKAQPDTRHAKSRPADSPPYGLRDDVQAYMRALSATDPDLDSAWLRSTVGQARPVPLVTRLIMPPPAGTPKNWAAYRERFIEPRRIQAGLEFWAAHESALDQAERRWGVPQELIVGIIGVETLYGRLTGGFKVLDALATLAFDFPKGRSDRSAFFRDELTALLQLARRQHLDLNQLQGSYAGAIGWGQFMPSSWIRYGLDFDGDGAVTLHTSAADNIGSVAHFLAAHGWQRGMPTHHGVQPPTDSVALARLLAPDIVPSFTATQMTAAGARLSPAGAAQTGSMALVQLQNGHDAPSYVAGTENFWVVTRYNWSSYYAMAVIELGQAIAAQRRRVSVLPSAPPSPAASSAPAATSAAPLPR
jgi:membrane-bound lytic murein transglycosylase B